MNLKICTTTYNNNITDFKTIFFFKKTCLYYLNLKQNFFHCIDALILCDIRTLLIYITVLCEIPNNSKCVITNRIKVTYRISTSRPCSIMGTAFCCTVISSFNPRFCCKLATLCGCISRSENVCPAKTFSTIGFMAR